MLKNKCPNYGKSDCRPPLHMLDCQTSVCISEFARPRGKPVHQSDKWDQLMSPVSFYIVIPATEMTFRLRMSTPPNLSKTSLCTKWSGAHKCKGGPATTFSMVGIGVHSRRRQRKVTKIMTVLSTRMTMSCQLVPLPGIFQTVYFLQLTQGPLVPELNYYCWMTLLL